MGKSRSCNNLKTACSFLMKLATCSFLMKLATWIDSRVEIMHILLLCLPNIIGPLPVFHRRGLKVYPSPMCPSVQLSVRPSIRPSAKSGSCDILKTVWSLLMKLCQPEVSVPLTYNGRNCGSCNNLNTARYFPMQTL